MPEPATPEPAIISTGDELLIRMRTPQPAARHFEPWINGTVKSIGIWWDDEPAVVLSDGRLLLLDDIDILVNMTRGTRQVS